MDQTGRTLLCPLLKSSTISLKSPSFPDINLILSPSSPPSIYSSQEYGRYPPTTSQRIPYAMQCFCLRCTLGYYDHCHTPAACAAQLIFQSPHQHDRWLLQCKLARLFVNTLVDFSSLLILVRTHWSFQVTRHPIGTNRTRNLSAFLRDSFLSSIIGEVRNGVGRDFDS